tara:strand:+ start:9066 stop:9998 length:933 start_codon:yes stop_codon:yes gene_type:complete
MHENFMRRNGGVGFSTKGPPATLIIERAEEFCFRDERKVPFSNYEVEQLSSILSSVQKDRNLPSAISVTATGNLGTHVGLGSGTSIRLACLEGLFILNSTHAKREELVRHSRRGGTSGIGINAYFDGGLIFDLGVRNESNVFLPSSAANSDNIPSTLPPLHMPDWHLGICIPRTVSYKSQDDEISFFRRTAPINSQGSFEAAYYALFGVYAAVLESDYERFCRAISAIQNVTWKRLERSEYGNELRRIESDIGRFNVDCIGMSSLGPALFFFGSKSSLENISESELSKQHDVFVTGVNNAGRLIREVGHA